MVERFFDRIAAIWDSALDQPRELVVLRMTLLLLLFFGPEDQRLELAARVLALPMLLSPELCRSRGLWAVLAVIEGLSTVGNWYVQDNHKFLICYWTLTCCLALWSRDADRALEWNGRLLIALAFTFAVFWKFLGGEILTGEFFQHAFLTDQRFTAFASMVTGLTGQALGANFETVNLLEAFPAEGARAALETNARVHAAGQVMGWMMVGVEALLMLTFWRSFFQPESELHDWTLIAFCAFTYTLTPVVGFGFILAVMGFAQCGVAKRDVRQAYIWTFILVQFAQYPTMEFIAQALTGIR